MALILARVYNKGTVLIPGRIFAIVNTVVVIGQVDLKKAAVEWWRMALNTLT